MVDGCPGPLPRAEREGQRTEDGAPQRGSEDPPTSDFGAASDDEGDRGDRDHSLRHSCDRWYFKLDATTFRNTIRRCHQ